MPGGGAGAFRFLFAKFTEVFGMVEYFNNQELSSHINKIFRGKLKKKDENANLKLKR